MSKVRNPPVDSSVTATTVAKINLGVNALVFKNPITGVAKRILSLYAPSKKKSPAISSPLQRVYFFSPYPLSPATLAHFASYGIQFTAKPTEEISYTLVITEGGKLRKFLSSIPVGRECMEWWWTHMSIPGLLQKHHINLYDAQWGGGLPTRYPYNFIKFLNRIKDWFRGNQGLITQIEHRTHFAVTVHDLIPLKLTRMFPLTLGELQERIESWLFRLRVAANLHMADTIITVSPAVKEDLINFFSNSFSDNTKNIVVHPNGVRGIQRSSDTKKPANPISYEYLNPVAKKIIIPKLNNVPTLPKPYIFYIGGFNPRKNLPILITALSGVVGNKKISAALIIAGKLNRYFKQILVPLLEQVGYPVIALGYVSDQGLPRYFQESAGLCYPSLAEGFGMPPLEALQVGTPVIIDEGLPINKSSNGNTGVSAVVEWLAKVESVKQIQVGKNFPQITALKKWWHENVIALNLSPKNPHAREELTMALSTLLHKKTKEKKEKLKSPPLFIRANFGATSPLVWNNLAESYRRLLISRVEINKK